MVTIPLNWLSWHTDIAPAHSESRSHRRTDTYTSMRTHCYERLAVEHAHAGTNICTYMYANTYMFNAVLIAAMPMRTIKRAASMLTLIRAQCIWYCCWCSNRAAGKDKDTMSLRVCWYTYKI